MATQFDFNGLKDRGVIGGQVKISEKKRTFATFLREEFKWSCCKIAT